jgi:hypothetical protein
MEFFSQMLKLPLAAFVFSIEMLAKTMQGLQKIAYRGIDIIADGVDEARVDVSDIERDVPGDVTSGAMGYSAEATHPITRMEESKMPDKDLGSDMLKLVRYKILFVKRDLELAFPEKEDLVAENIDAAGYTAWKIAEFIQDLGEVEIPKKWRDKKYPRDVTNETAPKINKLDEEDKKYLRVYYEVLERYPRERFKFEERQIEVLEQIRDKI